LNDLEETPEEREQRKASDPNSPDPQEEYLDFLFTNLMLHAYRLENKHFNSTDQSAEDFFQDISSKADDERDSGRDEIEKAVEPEDVNTGEGGDSPLDLTL